MKYIIPICCFLTISLSTFSQDTRIFYRNDVQLNSGYTSYDGYKNISLNEKGINRFATIVSYDGFLTERLSIGAFAGFTTSYLKNDSAYYSSDWTGSDGGYYTQKRKERRHFIGVKASTYFINTTNLQTYFSVGLAVGRKRAYNRYGKEIYTQDDRRIVFMYDLHLGLNYYFNDHWGATGSIGYPLSIFKIGLTYRY